MGSPIFPVSAASGGSGAIIVPDDQFFADTTERDAYFVSNPSKLVEGAQCVIGTTSLQLQEYRSSAWIDMTPVVRGPAGSDGAKGDDGEFPVIHTLTEKTTPVSADVFVIEDSAESYAQKKVLYSTILGLIPDQLSDLSDDATHRLVTDTLISTWNAKQAALGYTAENAANKGAASGYAPLGSDSKIPSTYLPAISITSVVVSETEPSSPTEGMVWIKVSTGVSKIYDVDTTTWYEISNTSGHVTTVNGNAGPTVSLDSTDIPVDTTNFDNNLSSADDTVQKALETIDAMSGGGNTLPVADTTAIVKGSSDATKLVRIEADGIATGTTRVITMPNQDVNLTPGSGTFEGAIGAKKTAFNTDFGTATGTTCQGNDSRLSDTRIPTSHTHGNITNGGLIGSTSGVPLITGASGILQAGSFGTTAGTFCQGNDSRLSDVRSPDINGLTAETSIADDDLVAIYDTSASANRKMTKANFVSGLSSAGGVEYITRALEGVVYETTLMYWVAPVTCTIASCSIALSSNPSAASTYCYVQVMKNGLMETDSIFSSDVPMVISNSTTATNGIYQANGALDSNQTTLTAGDVIQFRVNQADAGSADLLINMLIISNNLDTTLDGGSA